MTKPVITSRTTKGTALTYSELDTNFSNLQNATISVTDGSNTKAFNLNDTITFTAGTNVTLSVNPTTGAITINSSAGNNYTLPTASTTTLGGVKIDGTTIAINSGVISTIGSSVVSQLLTSYSSGDQTVTVNASSTNALILGTLSGAGSGGLLLRTSLTGSISLTTGQVGISGYLNINQRDMDTSTITAGYSSPSIAINGTRTFPGFGSGLIMVSNRTTGACALWICSGLGQIATQIAAAGTPIGQVSWDVGNGFFIWTNTTGSNALFNFMTIRIQAI